MRLIKIKVNGKTFHVRDCKGIAAVRGLMFDDIKGYDGALIHANNIWMPFVKHTLELFFLDEKFKILSKERAIPLTLNPNTWKVYKNNKAKYCLEIKSRN